jgi:hypothetical protein
MGAYYADSTNIVVFPTTKREFGDRKSRLLTEQNLVDIVNRILDVKSFVITKNFVYNSSFEFNIYGYFFKVDNIGSLVDLIVDSETTNGIEINDNSCIYANIHTIVTGDYEELYGSDNNGSYDGVVFTMNNPLSNTEKWLKILKYSTEYGKWIVPVESYAKFSGRSITSPIDCGEM